MAAAVPLVKVSDIEAVEPDPVIGVIPATAALVQANVAPAVAEVMV